jgi:uncharacterized protein (UPF0147 family)
MQYLTYEEYISIGGTLEMTAFDRNIDRVCGMLDNATFGRLEKMTEIPRQVRACCRELVEYLANNVEQGNVSSKSQSAGGVSESVSYTNKTTEDIENECANIIFHFLGSVKTDKGTPLLYRGAMC